MAALAPAGQGDRLIRFRDVVAGYGGQDLRGDDLPPTACAGPGFIMQQRIAHRNAGIKHRSVSQLPISKVLFGDKPLDDKRRIVNLLETVDHLRKRFPRVQFKSLIMSDLDSQEQLEELSQTSIFVTPIGSSSFRLIYLPEGAHAILVGAPGAPSLCQ